MRASGRAQQRAKVVLLSILSLCGRVSAQPLEVVVSGESPRHATQDEPAAASVVREHELQAPGASAADVLEQIPGVQLQRTGASSDLATASLRGASAAQVPVYLAGVRINDEVTGSADLSRLPLWMLDRIEVFRGNAPARADRLGIGGAIFFEPRVPRRLELRAGQLLGSFGTRGSWLSSALGSPRAGAMLALRRDSAVNDYEFENDAGTRFESGDDRRDRRRNADYTAWDGWAIGVQRFGPRARVVSVINVFRREQGVTGLSVIPAERSRAAVQRVLAAVTARLGCGREPSHDECNLELTTSGLSAKSSLFDPAAELSLGALRSESAGVRVTHSARLRVSLTPAVAGGASAELSRESLRLSRPRSNGSVFVEAATRDTLRAALTSEYSPAPRWSLLALGAAECHATQGAGSARNCEPEPQLRAGAAWLLTQQVSLLANAGRYVRTPALAELYGQSPLVRGNAELEPERALAADVGARLQLRPANGWIRYLEADVFAFRRHVAGLIAYQRSLRQLTPFNLGRAAVQGIELAAHAALASRLHSHLALTLLDARDVSAARILRNDLVPLLSRLTLAHETQVEVLSHPSIGSTSLALRLTHRSSRYQDPAGLIVIPAQTGLDLSLTQALWRERLMLRARLQNAFDLPEWDVVGLPLPGRALYASAEAVLP
jgi:iron complex outermembrane receptor protein